MPDTFSNNYSPTCWNCHRLSPVAAPSFCTSCGKPLAQPSPYDSLYETGPLPLQMPDGKAPGRCFYTNGLLLSCAACHRLHRIDTQECVCGAKHSLIESNLSFPNPSGGGTGTNQAVVGIPIGTMETIRGELLGITEIPERVQCILFRYGTLIVVSSQFVRLFSRPQPDASASWNSAGTQEGPWSETGIIPLNYAREEKIHYAEVADGMLFVQAKTGITLISLSSNTVIASWQEACPEQTAAAYDAASKSWVRVTDRQGQAILKRGNGSGESEGTSELPLACGITDITDLRVGAPFGGQPEAFLAMRNRGIVRVALGAESTMMGAPRPLLVQPTNAYWYRLAIVPPPPGVDAAGPVQNYPVLLAWGATTEPLGILASWSEAANGTPAEPRVLQRLQGDFETYLVVGRNARAYVIRRGQGGSPPTLLSIPFASPTSPNVGFGGGQLAVTETPLETRRTLTGAPIALWGDRTAGADPNNQPGVRLVMPVRDTFYELALMNPETGVMTSFGFPTMNSPLFAVADKEFVIASPEDSSMNILRTFELRS